MVDAHNQSFFGKNTALFVQSGAKSEPHIFLRLIKKKPDGSWEKLTNREGITIKCGIEEIIMILDVLQGNRNKWSTVHGFNEDKKSIIFNWDENKRLWINIGDYRKQLVFPQTELFKLLLAHILKEKIEFSTVSSISNESEQETPVKKEPVSPVGENEPVQKNSLQIVEEKITTNDEVTQIQGKIKNETNAALYIEFSPEKELWVAKSKIRSTYNPNNQDIQKFSIDSWILRKNKIIS